MSDQNNLKTTETENFRATNGRKKLIRPIIMYPFKDPLIKEHINLLIDEIIKITTNDEEKRYEKPILIVNNQTHHRAKWASELQKKNLNEFYQKYQNKIEIKKVWSVDTCQMWLAGLGKAYDRCLDSGGTNDVFWLIPGDFHYKLSGGLEAIKKMQELPLDVYDGNSQLCLGEINSPPNSSKQLIDTYGTYGLLYTWFPAEAQGLRNITVKPRTEFFAIGQEYLKMALLKERWYAYEQTIVILLQNMRSDKPVRDVNTIELGGIEDDPSSRSTLSSAMQQIERTERVLKQFWRETNEIKSPGNWQDKFRQLNKQSEEVRGSAMTIISKLLS